MQDGGLYFVRHQRILAATESMFETFPAVWGVGVADVPPATISIRTAGRLIPVEGSQLIWIAPNSLFQWVMHRPFELKWESVLYRDACPKNLPTGACLFSVPVEQWPYSRTEIVNLLSAERPKISLEKMEVYNSTALRLKRLMAKEFMLNKDVRDYAQQLGVHRDVLTRYFKKCYDLTPIAYRNQLRLWASMLKLLFDSSKVVDVASENGFQNLKNFNQQFLRYSSISPSKLKARKGN